MPPASSAGTKATPVDHRPKTGLTFRGGLDDWERARGFGLGLVEVRADDFYNTGTGPVASLPNDLTVIVQGGRLSLGTPGPLNPSALAWLGELCAVAEPAAIVQPAGYCRTAEVELPTHCAVRCDRKHADVIATHVREARESLDRALLIENVPTQLRIPAPLHEADFLNRICESAACGLMIDVTVLWARARNTDLDPLGWLGRVDPGHVVGLRVSTAEERGGRWYVGGGGIPGEAWALADAAWSMLAPRLLLTSHLWDLPHPEHLDRQLQAMGRIVAGGTGDPVGPESVTRRE